MDQVHLFSLSSQKADWLAHRQAVIAENVANVNSPGYTAKDITPFADVMQNTALSQAASDPMHLAGFGADAASPETTRSESWDVKHSGNTVTVEQEMLKAGEVSRDYSLNTSIIKSFHRMYLTTVRG